MRRRSSKVKSWTLVCSHKHLSKNISDIYLGGIVSKKFWGLPVHNSWENSIFCSLEQVLDSCSLFWCRFGKSCSEKTRFDFRKNKFILAVNIGLFTLFDKLYHLMSAFFKSLELKIWTWHLVIFILLWPKC